MAKLAVLMTLLPLLGSVACQNGNAPGSIPSSPKPVIPDPPPRQNSSGSSPPRPRAPTNPRPTPPSPAAYPPPPPVHSPNPSPPISPSSLSPPSSAPPTYPPPPPNPSPLVSPPTLSPPSSTPPTYPPPPNTSPPSSTPPTYPPPPNPSPSISPPTPSPPSSTPPTYPPPPNSSPPISPPTPSPSSSTPPAYPPPPNPSPVISSPGLSPSSSTPPTYPPPPNPPPSPPTYPPSPSPLSPIPPTNAPNTSPSPMPPSQPPSASPTTPLHPSPSTSPTNNAPSMSPSPISPSQPPSASPQTPVNFSPSPSPKNNAPSTSPSPMSPSQPPSASPPTPVYPSPSPSPSILSPSTYPTPGPSPSPSSSISSPPSYPPSPSPAPSGLSVGYYTYSCPNAESIVREAVKSATDSNRGTGAGLIRLFFHDCFVEGCDASVLLNTTGSTQPTERASAPNLSLRGFEVIDAAKAKLEATCPGVVSCADIVAFAGRDATFFLSGNAVDFDMPAGRYDGRVSLDSAALANLPPPFASLQDLKNMFAGKGLDTDDMVTLSGAHTVGRSHCSSFSDRIPPNASDMNATLASMLSGQCNGNGGATVPQDLVTPDGLDSQYYRNVLNHEVLFGSDAALLASNQTAGMVRDNAFTPGLWEAKFKAAMVKMGRAGVKTSAEGEIRNKCWMVNPVSG